jgi:serine/threonine-protein kinase
MLSADDLDFGAALAGRYSLERELGRGGMGIVYLAREVVLDRQVAIKRLPVAFADDARARERFLREARTAAQLFHPNIVPIYRVDEVGAHVFFVMGFVDGDTAGDIVRRRGPMHATHAIRVLRDAALALGYGHARGVVHRDVKPDNILIEKAGGRALVTDFGIAHQAGADSLTHDGQLLGSFHYMNPEQIGGASVDGRSDVYALGALAHFLLTGRPPFDAPTATAVLAKHLNEPAPPIASVADGIPTRLAAAVDRCLSKDPAARFATAEAFAEALEEADRRREIPPTLRTWVQGTGAWDPGMVIVSALTLVTIASVGNFALLIAPLAYAWLQRIRATRRVLAMGYDTRDMAAAITAELDRRNEDALDIELRPTRLVKGLRWVAIGSMLYTAVAWAAFSVVASMPDLDWGDPRVSLLVRLTAIGSMATAMLSVATGLLAELISPSKVFFRAGMTDLRWRLAFWRSRAGALFARAIRRGPKKGESVAGDRPTEVVVGVAAASLYAALPKELRKELASLPEVVAQLELPARELRSRRQRMEDLALAAAKPLRPASGATDVEQVRRDTVEELEAARGRVERQLASTIAALETIRLDLLRLHAGRGSTADLTAALNAAMGIADEVSITLESRAAVEEIVMPSSTRDRA